MKRHAFIFAVFLRIYTSLPGEERVQDPTLEKGIEVLRQLERQFDRLERFAYRVQLRSRMGAEESERSFTFAFEAPAKVHVHHFRPEERMLYLSAEELVEYIPAARKALKTDLGKLSESERKDLLTAVMSRSVVDGLRIGDVESLVRRLVKVDMEKRDGKIEWVFSGEGPEYRLRIDPVRLVLLESELYDKDGISFTSRAGDFREIDPGVWFPTDLQNRHRTPRGMVENRIQIDRIEVNEEVDGSLFHFVLPGGALWHRP